MIRCNSQTQVVEEDLLLKINEIREKLEKAEDVEEADLLEKERVIMERRAARMKVKESLNCFKWELESISIVLTLGKHQFKTVDSFKGGRSPKTD